MSLRNESLEKKEQALPPSAVKLTQSISISGFNITIVSISLNIRTVYFRRLAS